jgi:nucleoside 2-deoxyribosyltransferase
MRIYLAGPLFTTAERAFNAELSQGLENLGHVVWLPQENEPRKRDRRVIFETDVLGINQNEVVVANMDGSDPDSGTSWECGYAYAKGKPIILFRTDFRCSNEGGALFNLMLTESAREVILCVNKSPTEIATLIGQALARL